MKALAAGFENSEKSRVQNQFVRHVSAQFALIFLSIFSNVNARYVSMPADVKRRVAMSHSLAKADRHVVRLPGETNVTQATGRTRSRLATCNLPVLPLNAYSISVSLYIERIIYDGRLAAAAHRSVHLPCRQHRAALLMVFPARIIFVASMP